jgi:membrane-bound lytic murein transglycosylase MltF
MMHRETFIAKLTEIQQIVEQLLAQLQANEHDAFAAHLYRSRKEYRQLANGQARAASKSSGA